MVNLLFLDYGAIGEGYSFCFEEGEGHEGSLMPSRLVVLLSRTFNIIERSLIILYVNEIELILCGEGSHA